VADREKGETVAATHGGSTLGGGGEGRGRGWVGGGAEAAGKPHRRATSAAVRPLG